MKGDGAVDEIQAVKRRELDILKTVDGLCRRHGLRYFAEGGTCLGAVRHKGFIPWDDDIDIGMPRKDFDQFRVIAKRELPEPLQLVDYNDVPQITNMFLKVQDTTTTWIERESLPYPGRYVGVNIDIFAYDGCPGDEGEKRRLEQRLERLRCLNRLLRMRQPTAPFLPVKKLIVNAAGALLPFNWGSRRAEALLRRYDLDSSERTHMLMWYDFPARCALEYAPLPFEDMMLPCPADYDTYLTGMFGDYMTPPPEDQRDSGHHVAYHSLEKSYLTRWWERENT